MNGRCDGFCGDPECPRCYPGILDEARRQRDEERADYEHQRRKDDEADGCLSERDAALEWGGMDQ